MEFVKLYISQDIPQKIEGTFCRWAIIKWFMDLESEKADFGWILGKLSEGLPKVAQRFVGEAIYGIQTRGYVRLRNVRICITLTNSFESG